MRDNSAAGNKRHTRNIVLAVFTIWAIGISVAVLAYGSQARDTSAKAQTLAQQNKERINDIQRSRIASCERNYRSFRDVFKPFFRPPDQQTPKERSDQRKFNRIIDAHIHHCQAQVEASK